MMAQKGQVKEQITDGQFKQMLEGMSGSDNQPKMTYTRRGGFDDDDDDSAFALIDLVSPLRNALPRHAHARVALWCAVDDLLDGL